MSTSAHVDVAIVGYGPVGQLAAILLGAAGHRVAVFERWPEPYPLPRAVHYDHEIARIFQLAGVAERLAPISERASGYEWRNAAGETLLLMDWMPEGRSGWPTATMFSEPLLERELDAAARDTPGVTVYRGWDVDGVIDSADHVTVSAGAGQLNRSAWVPTGGRAEVTARFVIGADGANSFVRRTMGVENEDLGFAFDWLIADTIPADPALLAGVNRQICDPERPTTMVSGGPGRRRWEWMLLPGETTAQILDEDDDVVWGLLARSGVGRQDVTLERSAVYSFRARWAQRWRRGRLLLAGDAAHLMPPFAGQGMCSGLRDVANLAWRLDLILRNRAGDALLDDYSTERIGHVRHAIQASVALGAIICVSDPAAAAARDQEMLAAAAHPELAPPPPPEARLGPGTLAGDDPTAGTLFPQGRVRVNGVTGRCDDVVGRGFVLYARDADPHDLLDDAARSTLTALGGRCAHVTDAMDVGGVYRRWFETRDVSATLVRPDFYVFGSVADATRAGELVADLRARLAAGRSPRPG